MPVPAGDLQHEMLLKVLKDALYTATPALPLDSKATILDVGTGTGRWAVDMARRYPAARVYGIDLRQVDIHPDTAASGCLPLPANVVFETVNVMEGFPFNTGTFDFVHSRLLVGGITSWETYLANLYRITRRGGRVECIEVELMPVFRRGCKVPAIEAWTRLSSDLLRKRNLDPECAKSLQERMTQASFSSVDERILDVPVGSWPEAVEDKAIGKLAFEFDEHMIAWMQGSLVEQGLLSAHEADRMAAAVLAEYKDGSLELSLRWHFCSGLKAP
jgi:ubiquinone/menaquinone biosynthesis C-methylase UbiE